MKTRSILLFIAVIAAIPIGAHGSDYQQIKRNND